MKKRLSIACLLIIFSCVIMAQENLSFRRLTARDGLTSHQIDRIARDGKGQLWLSTKYGLHSYDGYRVKTFTLPEGVMPNLRGFAIDSLDNILVFDQFGMYYLDTRAPRRFDERQTLQPISLDSLTHGQFTGVPYLLKQTKENGIVMCGAQTLYATRGLSVHLQAPVSDVCDATGGKGLLLLMQDGTLLHVDRGGQQRTVTTIPEQGKMLMVKQDSKGRIWMFNRFNKTLVCVDGNGHPMEEAVTREIVKYAPINDLEEKTDGKLIFATNSDGILTLDAHHQLTLIQNNERNPFSLPNNHLNTLLVDDEDIVWGASNKDGLFWTKMSRFTPLRIDTPTKEDVACINETDKGELILGYDGGGLQIGQERYSTKRSRLTSNLVVSVSRGSHCFYITTYGGGIMTMDFDGRNIAPLKLDIDHQTCHLEMTKTVLELPNGMLWVGTFHHGLYCLTRNETGGFSLQKSFNMLNSPIRTDCITSLRLMPDGKAIIVSTSTGLYRVDIGSLQVTPINDEIDCIACLVDGQGLIWIGTPQGLRLMDKDGKWMEIPLSESALNSQIIGLAQDAHGAIHVLTPFALTTIEKQMGHRMTAFTQFSNESLGSITFMSNSLFCNNRDQVLVGANGSYAVIPTGASAEYASDRALTFSTLLLDGRDICQVTDRIPAGHSITFEVTNMSFWGTQAYEYRLDGGEWTSALNNRIALGLLSPGWYTLEARPHNGSDDSIQMISFRVGEWWQHWAVKTLFYLLLVCGVALIIYLLIKRMRSIKPFQVSATNHEGDTPDAQFLSTIAQVIERNMKDAEFSVEELAQQVNMSRSNLFRRVKKLTGKTPSELIQDIRLQRAKQMLEQQGSTVSQTAYEVGLSPRQLSSLFKKRYGVTPSMRKTV